MSILDSSADAGHKALDPIAAKIKNPFNTTVKNKGLRGSDFPGGFGIVEYINGVPQTGSGLGDLTLIGTNMPMQPFTFGLEQRLNKDYYPGNPEPSVHVMGSKEDDLVIHGRFKDKHFKDPDYYGAAYQLALALRAMCKRGNLVHFGMFSEDGEYLRYGYLEKVNFKMNKLSWIDYELTFFVFGETQPRNNFFAAPEKSAPDSINSGLIQAATDFNSSYGAAPATMPTSIAGEINALTSSIASNINLVTGFVQTIITTASDIKKAANRALGLIQAVRLQLNSFRRQLDQLQGRSGFDNLSSAGNQVTKGLDTYKNKSYIANTKTSSLTKSAYLAQMQVQFENIARTLPLTRYKVMPSDTLQKIAIKFYGAQDNWETIYTHNKLVTTVLVPGTVLEIPKV